MKDHAMESMQLINPVRPAAGYLGGKSKLAKTIISIIDTVPHVTYCEPFVGMGGIFLRRHRRPKSEVINDYNAEVANFFRVLNRHYQPFLDMIKWQITTRREFDRLARTRPDTLTDLERAARFLYLQRLAFGGKATGQYFGVSVASSGGFNLTKLVPMLEDLHERLAGVVIESLDYKAFIKRYDRPQTLFYLDPPYYGNEDDYGKGLFSRSEFELMAELLGALQGKFILSLNDRPEVRATFAAFNLTQVTTTYTVDVAKAKVVGELIISNL